jgi:hypothetical protein
MHRASSLFDHGDDTPKKSADVDQTTRCHVEEGGSLQHTLTCLLLDAVGMLSVMFKVGHCYAAARKQRVAIYLTCDPSRSCIMSTNQGVALQWAGGKLRSL